MFNNLSKFSITILQWNSLICMQCQSRVQSYRDIRQCTSTQCKPCFTTIVSWLWYSHSDLGKLCGGWPGKWPCHPNRWCALHKQTYPGHQLSGSKLSGWAILTFLALVKVGFPSGSGVVSEVVCLSSDLLTVDCLFYSASGGDVKDDWTPKVRVCASITSNGLIPPGLTQFGGWKIFYQVDELWWSWPTWIRLLIGTGNGRSYARWVRPWIDSTFAIYLPRDRISCLEVKQSSCHM